MPHAQISVLRESGLDPFVADLLESLANRVQDGEAIDAEQLAREYPEQAEQLQRLLPAVQLLAALDKSAAAGAFPPSQVDTDSGTLVDFRILREVGRGGMGIVYEAIQISLNRRVALKMLPYAATMDPKQLQRFKNEALAAASLRHEHIVHVYGVGCERGVHYYAMEFIDGLTLAQIIAAMPEGAKVNRDAPAERENKDEGGRMKEEG